MDGFRKGGGGFWEGLILEGATHGPVAGAIRAMARFCRMLGTLLNAGVPLVQALNVARRSLGNQILVDAVSTSIDRVKEGAQLGKSLADCKSLFPGPVLEMIAVGEESGKLDQKINAHRGGDGKLDLDRNLKTAVAFSGAGDAVFHRRIHWNTIFIGMIIPIFKMQDYIK